MIKAFVPQDKDAMVGIDSVQTLRMNGKHRSRLFLP
jgi:hypothetical protein